MGFSPHVLQNNVKAAQALGATSKITVFITISTVLSSWPPPGFSCPYLTNYMKINVFIDIVTPNGLLNFVIFSFFFQIPNYRKTKKTWIIYFSTLFPLCWTLAPPMHMLFPLKCLKKSTENAPVKTHEI